MSSSPLPIHLAPTPAEAPFTYVVMHYRSTCRCGASSSWTESYSRHLLRSRVGFKLVDHLIPLSGTPEWRIPFEHRFAAPRQTPFCAACASEALVVHLPSPEPPAARVPLHLVTEPAPKARAPRTPSPGKLVANLFE